MSCDDRLLDVKLRSNVFSALTASPQTDDGEDEPQKSHSRPQACANDCDVSASCCCLI